MSVPSLTAADQRVIEGWRAALAREPSVLPAGVEPVQTRLIRAVGRGRLPDAGDVFVKCMGFPRGRDRLRYWLRPLPAAHEAALLTSVAAAGVPCPAVVAVAGARDGLGRPRMSMLVTHAVPVDPAGVPRLQACAEVARRLADAGVFHGDLHGGNFLVRPDGASVILDLQSMRRPLFGVGAGLRHRMAARLLAHDWAEPERPRAVVDAGLIGSSGLATALAAARRWRVLAVRRRIRRCLTESSEFVVRRRGWGWLAQRRRLASGGAWVQTGRLTRRLWLGHRVAEVLMLESPRLGAAFWKSWWLPGLQSVYIADPSGVTLFQEHAQRWLDALRRFESDDLGAVRATPTPTDMEAPWSWSVRREV